MILLCHLTPIENDPLVEWLKTHFEVIEFSSEVHALEWLHTEQEKISAVIVLESDPKRIQNSILLQYANQLKNGMTAVISHSLSLDPLIELLEKKVATRFYVSPYDFEVIRRDIFYAQMNLSLPHKLVETSQEKVPKVLIVDDEVQASKYLIKNIETFNPKFELLSSENAEEALKLIEKHKGEIKVVISDHQMPGMKGDDFLKKIKIEKSNIVRILTSAYGEIDVALNAINQGEIFGYLKKPWSARQIFLLINEALERSMELDRERALIQKEFDIHHKETTNSRKQLIQEKIRNKYLNKNIHRSVSIFMNCLDSIILDYPNASSVWTVKYSLLNEKIAEDFLLGISKNIDQFLKIEKKTEFKKNGIDDAIRKQFQSFDLQEKEDKGNAINFLIYEIKKSISTLMTFSGVDLSLNVKKTKIQEFTDSEFKINLNNQNKIIFLTHLLAPVKIVSQSLIKQQVSLFNLIWMSEVLGMEIIYQGSKQSLNLVIQYEFNKNGH